MIFKYIRNFIGPREMNSRLKETLLLSLFFTCNTIFAGPICQNEQIISQTFENGSKWEFCWEHKNKEGIILKEMFFTTPDGLERKVLKEISLAQIHVAFDDNSHQVFHIDEFGLGGNNLQNLSSAQCNNGQFQIVDDKNVLCIQVNNRGYIYKDYDEKKQGQLLDIYSQSNTDGYTWIIRWQLHDDGTIEPSIGATGTLHTFGTNTNYGDAIGNSGSIAIASAINYFWRIHFDIAENGTNDVVEEFNVTPSADGSEKNLSVTQLSIETGRTIDQQLKRSWRVRDGIIANDDGHPVSYHLEPLNTGYQYNGHDGQEWAQSDLYITQFNVCERFVTNNPGNEGCLSDITGFLDEQNINGADIVIWYGINYHHFPRDEDLPYMPTRWDNFQLIPRDWTATSPMTF